MSDAKRLLRILLVEYRTLVREAFRSLLEQSGAFVVVAERYDLTDVIKDLDTYSPDVVLLIIDNLGDQDFASLRRLPEVAERASILVVTRDSDPNLHAHAIELGAMGVVMEDQTSQVLAKAIQKVVAGEIWLDRMGTAGVVNRLTRRRIDVDPEVAKIESLTARERQIVALITEGLTNKDIAERLFISEATARNHLTSILDKLGLGDRFQLTVYAFRRGLVLCPHTPAMLRVAATMNRYADERTTPSRRRSGA